VGVSGSKYSGHRSQGCYLLSMQGLNESFLPPISKLRVMDQAKRLPNLGLTTGPETVYCCAHVALPHHRFCSYTLAR